MTALTAEALAACRQSMLREKRESTSYLSDSNYWYLPNRKHLAARRHIELQARRDVLEAALGKIRHGDRVVLDWDGRPVRAEVLRCRPTRLIEGSLTLDLRELPPTDGWDADSLRGQSRSMGRQRLDGYRSSRRLPAED